MNLNKRLTDAAKRIDDLEHQLAEARSCDIWLTDNLSLWMAFMMKAHRDADRALDEAQGKNEAVKRDHVHPLLSMTGYPCKVCAILCP